MIIRNSNTPSMIWQISNAWIETEDSLYDVRDSTFESGFKSKELRGSP